MKARSKLEWAFYDLKRRRAGCNDIKKEFESLGREFGCYGIEMGASHHEEAAHRIAQAHAKHAFGHLGREPAAPLPQMGKASFDSGSLGKPGSDAEVGTTPDVVQHMRQQGLVVLQVSVHYGDCRS